VKTRSRIVVALGLLAFAGTRAASGRSEAAAMHRAPTAATAAPSAASQPRAADDIREIRGPVPLDRRVPAWWYGAGALAAAVAAFALARARHPASRRPLPAHVRALAALEAQRRAPDPSPRGFSVALSEIIRGYVEECFPVRAAHRTTDELLADLLADNSPVATFRSELRLFLHQCDLGKFARWSLTAADREAMLTSAESFVRATAAAATRRPATDRAPAHAGHCS
jgi:hypothetical protein